ncbi:hypothetical protein F4823DRAFT_560895 [Ustulina deusta]|nr:hypothetical protein F4823DRAFT_560895 [Ustulina deusta]
MLPTRHEEPKPHHLYVALYNLGSLYHWAFVVKNNQSSFLLDATVGAGNRKYRMCNWENDLAKESMTVLCDVMDLGDNSGVEYLLGIAESVPMPPEEDENFCQTWVESVLQRAGGDGCVLRAPIDQIRETLLQAASGYSNKRFGDPVKILEPF